MNQINIIHGDSISAMQSMKDNQYDLAIVDPEYGLGEDGLKNHSRGKAAAATKYIPKQWDRKPASYKYVEHLKRISKNQIIFGANHFIENIPNANSSCWIVWDKDNTGDFADCELAYTSFNSAVRKVKIRWNGMLQQDMKNKELRIHPTQKPAALYKWLLKNYAKPGDKIFDSHGGSMSHAIAAIDMGFDLDIYELDKDYYDSACKRIKNYVAQTDLSRPPVQINYITL